MTNNSCFSPSFSRCFPFLQQCFPFTRRCSISICLALSLSVPLHAITLVHYDFSNGSGTQVTDLSGLGNHGTLTNFANTSAGAGVYDVSEGWVSGGGLSMLENGVRSFVETSLALNSVANSDFTIEYTASSDLPSGWTPAVGSNTPTFGEGGAVLFTGIAINGLGYEVRLPDGSAPGASNAGQPTTQPWLKSPSPLDITSRHIAMAYSQASDTVEIFVDGISQGTTTTGFAFDPTLASPGNVFRIGNVGFDPTQQWGGVYSGVAISTETLGPSTFALTNGNRASTQLLYDFSDNGGTTVTDKSGKGRNGTLVGFTSTSAGSGAFNSTEGWVAGGGLSMIDDDVTSYVNTPLNVNTLTADFTLEAIVNYAAPIGFAPILGSSADPFNANEIVFLGLDAAQRSLGFNMPGGFARNQFVNHPWYNPPEGAGEEINHVALVFHDATGLTELYYNGVLAGTLSLPNTDMNSTALFRLGNVGYEIDEWDGVFYGFAVSNDALTPSTFVLQQAAPSADFDEDGDVDGRDFLVWQRGESPNPLSAADLALWQDQYGTSGIVAAVGVTVPEPTTSLLFLYGIYVLAGKTLRRA